MPWKLATVELEVYRSRVRGHARDYFDSLGDGALVTPREMNVDGETLLYSPVDIFVHVFLHERQHHGDVNTLLYQLGIEVPDRGIRVLPARTPSVMSRERPGRDQRRSA